MDEATLVSKQLKVLKAQQLISVLCSEIEMN